MDQKSMGAFIAAQRKALGLTQKELAQKLSVSDKAVSRWECGENAPDISLLPILAEIFSVTCDELIKGKKAQPSVEQVKSRYNDNFQKFKKRSYLSFGLSFLAVPVMFICWSLNYDFLSFALTLVLNMAAITLLAVFSVDAANDARSQPSPELSTKIAKIVLKNIYAAIEVMFFSVPFLFNIGLDSLAFYGPAALVAGLLVCLIIKSVYENLQIKKGQFFDGRKTENVSYNNTLKLKTIAVDIAIIALTLGVVSAINLLEGRFALRFSVDLITVSSILDKINIGFMVLYFVEIAGAFAFYFKKRKKD